MKRSWIALVIVFAMILVVAAQVAAQDAATPDTSITGTVRIGTWDNGVALDTWNTVIDHFKAAYPNITVSFEPVPQDYGTKLLAEFASNSAPDVFQVGDGDAATDVALGVAENLDPYISGANGFDASVMYPNLAAFGQVQGSTYYLTKDYSPLVLYYNKDLFDAADVTYPSKDWTWDDLLKAAQKLTVDSNGNDATSANFDPTNVQRWGIWLPDSWGDTLWTRGILPIIYQYGGDLISSDGTTATGHMNSEATVAGLQWYADLFNKYHIAPSKSDYSSFNGADLFAQQQVAMMWTGVWPMNSYETGSSALTFKWGSNILPAGPKGNANALCWAGFAMYSKSQNKDAAWTFMKYITAGEGAKDFAAYALTANQTIAQTQGLETDEYKGSVMADLANVKPIPDFTTQYWSACGDKYFQQELATVLDTGVAVQTAMDKAAGEVDQCLADKMAAATPAS